MRVSTNFNSTFIYGLVDPVSGFIRYIGKSDNPEHRLKSHIDNRNYSNTHKNNWIKSLISKGVRPTMEIIDEVPYENWIAREIETITLFKSAGANLVNGTLGGEGVTQTPEIRKKISESNKGRKGSCGNKGKTQSIEARAKMRLAKLGRKHTPEHIEKCAALKRGKSCNNNKPIKATNLKTREVTIYRTYIDAAKYTGMSEATVWRGVKNLINRPLKYTFEHDKS